MLCSHSTWVLPAVKFMFYNILVNQRVTKKFQKRLEKLIENTKKGIMYGEWNDNGRLLNY